MVLFQSPLAPAPTTWKKEGERRRRSAGTCSRMARRQALLSPVEKVKWRPSFTKIAKRGIVLPAMTDAET